MTDRLVHDSAVVLAEQMSFADFLVKYDGQAAEWHAGKVVEKMSNNPQHNFIVFFLAQVLSFFLSEREQGKVITDGVSMHINDTVPARQPDIMVLLSSNLDKLTSKHLNGPADIVVEVVSPGSSTVDRGAKFTEYENADVREYWLIDPLRKQVDIYALVGDGYYQRINKEARIMSRLLPDFALDNDILWQDELPTGRDLLAIVDGMASS